MVHDETDPTLAYLLSRLSPPDFPMPIGVIHAVQRPCYEEGVHAQIEAAKARKKPDLAGLIRGPETWTVK